MRTRTAPEGNSQQEVDTTASKDKTTSDGLTQILSTYADKSSLNGVIFIKSSKFILVKIIWTILLLGALAAMTWHLYELSKKYYTFGKQSQVDLQFATFDFPAVTVCNVNPIRKSKLDLASTQLRAIVRRLDPVVMAKDLETWRPEYEKDGDDDKERKKRATLTAKLDTASKLSVTKRKNNFFDNLNITDMKEPELEKIKSDSYKNSWESESQASSYDAITSRFTKLYNQETSDTRQRMGHSIKDILTQCSFAGRKCQQANFTLVHSSSFGNCYNLQYDKFVVRKSGPRFGLSLILYLEAHEYLPGITNSKGAQMVIHAPDTVPFPDDEGVTIGAGSETSIGLRRISISRLGSPHGTCSETSWFKTKYGVQYTRQTCQEICDMERIATRCKCYDGNKPTIYALLKDRATLTACQVGTKKEACMREAKWDFTTATDNACSCSSPCTEIDFRKFISAKPWPMPPFAQLMAQTTCKEDSTSVLCEYHKMEETTLRENFAKVNVFFETLNYEALSEEPDYTEFQYISDIGGTVGLYVGLSVLSMCEVGHLIIALVLYLCNSNPRRA